MAKITMTPRQLAGAGIFLVLLLGVMAFMLFSHNHAGGFDQDFAQPPAQTVAAAPEPQEQPVQVSPSQPARPIGKVYPKEIAYGEVVEIKDYIVPGKMMIFDFTSPYCPPCRRVAPRLEKLHFDRDDIVVVKVNINRPEAQGIDFGSPVARKYNLPHVPYFVVMPADRSRVIEGTAASKMVYDMLGKNEGR